MFVNGSKHMRPNQAIGCTTQAKGPTCQTKTLRFQKSSKKELTLLETISTLLCFSTYLVWGSAVNWLPNGKKYYHTFDDEWNFTGISVNFFKKDSLCLSPCMYLVCERTQYPLSCDAENPIEIMRGEPANNIYMHPKLWSYTHHCHHVILCQKNHVLPFAKDLLAKMIEESFVYITFNIGRFYDQCSPWRLVRLVLIWKIVLYIFFRCSNINIRWL